MEEMESNKVRYFRNGWLLNERGLLLFSSHFQNWEIKSNKCITSKQIIRLSKSMKYPWYYEPRRIIIFDEIYAIEYSFIDDFDSWVNTK